jgi:hypothetical protein
MAVGVIFKKSFINNLVKVQVYLEKEWGEETAIKFLKKIDNRINMLKSYPNSGINSAKIPGIRGFIILNLYDTRSNPAKRAF